MAWITAENFTFYEVGGKIRDELLGIKSNDVDYTVVYDGPKCNIDVIFDALQDYLKADKYKIFLVTPECFTIRAMFPKNHISLSGVADFVLARHEIGYWPGTRKPICEPGTLEQDLLRRDFTVNAMAKVPETGELIDPFNGQKDLDNKILKTPDKPDITLKEDPLRAFRAVRFAITKGFKIDPSVILAINMLDYRDLKKVSPERVIAEITKCCKYNSESTFRYLFITFPNLGEYITEKNIWFLPTLKQK